MPQTRTANIVHLSGWLVVQKVETISLGKQQGIAIVGDIHRHKPPCGAQPTDDSYPVLLTGTAAEIVIGWIRTHNSQDGPCPIKVSVDGALRRHKLILTVLVRYVEILEAQTGRLDPEATRPTGQ